MPKSTLSTVIAPPLGCSANVLRVDLVRVLLPNAEFFLNHYLHDYVHSFQALDTGGTG